MRLNPTNAEVLYNLLLIALVALGAHLAVRTVRWAGRALLASRLGAIATAQTATRFLGSLAAFLIWFIAAGFALREIGLPLETYLASASIIGLAVSFGSQSLVQDVIAGLTLIFTGLIDVGDMVEIGGQTGVVEAIGIRYIELRNVQGSVIYIANRNVTNVVKHPVGYVRVFVDATLPAGSDAAAAAKRIETAAAEAYRQFSGIMIKAPSVQRMLEGEGPNLVRVKFRVWPGQGVVVETAIRLQVIAAARASIPDYPDSMVAVHYRVEPAFVRRAAPALDVLRGLANEFRRPGEAEPRESAPARGPDRRGG